MWDWFTGWGEEPSAASWSKGLADAVEYAENIIDRVAVAKKWSAERYGQASDLLNRVASESSTPAEFWRRLATEWGTMMGPAAPDGWASLGSAFITAWKSSVGVEEARRLGQLWTQLEGTFTETVKDVQQAADPKQSAAPWIVGALLLGGLWIATR